MHFGTQMNGSSFGVKRSKFKVMVGPTCWKMYFVALLARYVKNQQTDFHTLVGVLEDKHELVRF